VSEPSAIETRVIDRLTTQLGWTEEHAKAVYPIMVAGIGEARLASTLNEAGEVDFTEHALTCEKIEAEVAQLFGPVVGPHCPWPMEMGDEGPILNMN
jgi:hypothetical protein